jgi:hypothetical protein
MEDCIGKLNLYNDRKICRKLPVHKTLETLVTSTSLSVDCLEFDKHKRKFVQGIHHSVMKVFLYIMVQSIGTMDKI